MKAERAVDIAHYRYAVQWSPEDGEFVATVAELPSLSWLAPTQTEALRGLADLVAEVVNDLAASGEVAPKPLSDRSYSGRLNLRVSTDLHRRLAMEAAQHHTSLNSYAIDLLDRRASA